MRNSSELMDVWFPVSKFLPLDFVLKVLMSTSRLVEVAQRICEANCGKSAYRLPFLVDGITSKKSLVQSKLRILTHPNTLPGFFPCFECV